VLTDTDFTIGPTRVSASKHHRDFSAVRGKKGPSGGSTTFGAPIAMGLFKRQQHWIPTGAALRPAIVRRQHDLGGMFDAPSVPDALVVPDRHATYCTLVINPSSHFRTSFQIRPNLSALDTTANVPLT
jgi:hypothetical protein